MIDELKNSIQAYAWGSHRALAELRGERGPSAEPEAELWMGAHVLSPSRLASTGQCLNEAIAATPERLLGAGVASSYANRLPFLLKVLAAAQPLSLQVHPSLEQAQRGFAADEANGIPLTAPHRNYKDPNHKPELLCALDEFWALRGFREPRMTLELIAELSLAALEDATAPLRREPNPSGISRTFAGLMRAPLDRQRALAREVSRACRERSELSSPFVDELRWAARIADLYPADVGVVVSLLLNLVRLAPGEAIYLPAGNLHAYLEGTGIELMASSDNVLRGGLTPKHVNVPELLAVLDFRPLPVEIVHPVARGPEYVYETTAREFCLSYFELGPASAVVDVAGPEIWLVTEGTVTLKPRSGAPLELSRGRSAFLGADTASLELRGTGRVFRAKVPD